MKTRDHSFSYFIANSLSAIAAWPFIDSYEQVYVHLDDDEAGRKATAELQTACRNLSDCSMHCCRHKDLSKCLQEGLRRPYEIREQ